MPFLPQELRVVAPRCYPVHDVRAVGRSKGKSTDDGSRQDLAAGGAEADREALRRAFADVKPLGGRSRKRVMPPDRGAAGPRKPAPEDRTATERLLIQCDRDGTVLGKRRKTHPSILESLEDPNLEVDASCDLHGRTAAEAERDVLRFVRSSQQSGDRWVLVIVGKGLHSPGGQGTLQDHVVDVLSKGPAARFVLAFRTAPRRLGGAGALALRLVDRL